MIKRITVSDMGCKHCAHKIEAALKALPDVWKVDISVPEGTIDVETNASGDQLTGAVEKAGFFVKKVETLSSETGGEKTFYFPSPNINQ